MLIMTDFLRIYTEVGFDVENECDREHGDGGVVSTPSSFPTCRRFWFVSRQGQSIIIAIRFISPQNYKVHVLVLVRIFVHKLNAQN
jgi:hypothetical protein